MQARKMPCHSAGNGTEASAWASIPVSRGARRCHWPDHRRSRRPAARHRPAALTRRTCGSCIRHNRHHPMQFLQRWGQIRRDQILRAGLRRNGPRISPLLIRSICMANWRLISPTIIARIAGGAGRRSRATCGSARQSTQPHEHAADRSERRNRAPEWYQAPGASGDATGPSRGRTGTLRRSDNLSRIRARELIIGHGVRYAVVINQSNLIAQGFG